jgi:hypothetical protein
MNHEISYLIPYTDSQRAIAAALRRMLRDAVTAYAGMNAGYIGPDPAPQIGVQMISHEPETGIEEFRFGWVTVQFRNDPPSEKEKDYPYTSETKYDKDFLWYEWDVKQFTGPMRLVIAETFRVVNEVVEQAVQNLPPHVSYADNLKGLTITIKPRGEEQANWRAIVKLEDRILNG